MSSTREHAEMVHAKKIAAHVVKLLRETRSETNMVTHKRRAREWFGFARRKRVCPAIRDRVAQAYSDVAVAIANGYAAGQLRSAATTSARSCRPALRLIEGGLSGEVRK